MSRGSRAAYPRAAHVARSPVVLGTLLATVLAVLTMHALTSHQVDGWTDSTYDAASAMHEGRHAVDAVARSANSSSRHDHDVPGNPLIALCALVVLGGVATQVRATVHARPAAHRSRPLAGGFFGPDPPVPRLAVARI